MTGPDIEIVAALPGEGVVRLDGGWVAPPPLGQPWSLPLKGMSKKQLRRYIRYLESQLRAAEVPEPLPLIDLPNVSVMRGGVRYPLGDRGAGWVAPQVEQ